VNGISYTLEEGDILGVVGESGCGKSVSMMSILRLLPEPPARIMGGQALLNGRDLLRMKYGEISRVRGAEISIVFQDPMTSLNPVMKIGDQIAEAMQVNLGLSYHEAIKKTIELLDRVGIPRPADRVKDYPHQFSGGMRQRVMIAIAISCKPKLLIADEPTTALDVTIQAQIVDLVKQLQQDLNMAVIWITHDLGVIARLAKRVNVMYAGHIIEMGPIRSVFKHPAHPYTIGLLGSLPKNQATDDGETGVSRDLIYIEGAPPDMVHLPKGCPFGMRCAYRSERCEVERPKLENVGEDHLAACWNLGQIDKRGVPLGYDGIGSSGGGSGHD
jgi:oligopeptide transport system ATP-binding protein